MKTPAPTACFRSLALGVCALVLVACFGAACAGCAGQNGSAGQSASNSQAGSASQSSSAVPSTDTSEILGSTAKEGAPHSVSGKAETIKGGLSDLVVSGSLFAKSKTVVSDKLCLIEITGAGVDRFGDPGLNLYLENRSNKTLDFWVNEKFSVEGKLCRAYLFETLNPGQSTSTFLQIDTADIGSTSPSALINLAGKILVDSPDDEIKTSYSITLESIPK